MPRPLPGMSDAGAALYVAGGVAVAGPAVDGGPARAGWDAGGRPVPCTPLVTRLDLTAFRNHRATRIESAAPVVVLNGPNGAGKTNVLEALSFLAPGRGLRRCRLSEADYRGMDHGNGGAPWAVAAELVTCDGPVRIGTGRDPQRPADTGTERRLLRIDGAPVRGQQALAERAAVVWLTPEHDRLFAESAGTRRRFLDRLVSAHDPDHVGRVSAYEHALRERSRLLKGPSRDPGWLDALERRLAAGGIAIVAARHHLIARLSTALAAETGPFLAPEIAAAGTLEGWLEREPALVAEDRMREALAAARDADAAQGGAAIGPHRSDLTARHPGTGEDARDCSTGEQKAMVIAIVLAYARLVAADRGAPPLLLLDEAAAHLDAGRRAALFEALAALRASAWMTGADRSLFSALGDRADFLSVQDGRVTSG